MSPLPSPTGGLAIALPEFSDHGSTTLAILAMLILARPRVRRDVARLLRASADVLDAPTQG